MGGTPSYKLTIAGDGTVLYQGIANVARKGRHGGYISQTALSQLLQEFRNAHFFALHDYSSAATDMPVRVITLQVGSVRKEVVDYGRETTSLGTPTGFSSGAPKALIQLENKIDQITGSKKWIKRYRLRKLI